MTPHLRCRLDGGRLTLDSDESLGVRIGRFAPRVAVRRAQRRIEWHAATLRSKNGGYDATHAEYGLRVELRIEPHDSAVILRLALENLGGTPLQIEELAPLCVRAGAQVAVGAGTDAWAVYRNGYQSWSGTRTYRVNERDRDPRWHFLRISHTDLRHPCSGRPGHFRSDGFTLIKNLRSGEALCLGFLEARRAFAGVVVDARDGTVHEISASADLDGITVAPGDIVTSEPLWVAAGFDEQALLAAYATAVGAAMNARVPEHTPTGWCSWYYYFNRVTEADIAENLAALASRGARCPCDYVMIDDGYQRAVGDWLETNAKFPHGMRWLAERIRADGFEAGIWLAPFIARPESRVFQDHPDWFVRTVNGDRQPALWNPVWGWKRQAYALDTTHPEVLSWLEELARTLARDFGYRILKLDFLFAAALPGQRYDPNATRAESLRRGLRAVRAGAGEDAFLLGCGCPLLPAIGLVDAMRIGADVAPFWTNWLSRGPLANLHGVATKNAIRNTLTRAFMHRRWWLNDPDCLMVRDTDTRLSLDEVRSLATAIALTDGLLVLSDRMDRLAGDRLDLSLRAHELRCGMPTAIDLMEHDVPELLLTRRPADTMLAVFNFRDHPVRRTVNLAACGITTEHAEEIWTARPVTVQDGWADVGEIPAHGCRVLRIPHPIPGR